MASQRKRHGHFENTLKELYLRLLTFLHQIQLPHQVLVKGQPWLPLIQLLPQLLVVGLRLLAQLFPEQGIHTSFIVKLRRVACWVVLLLASN